MKEVIQILNLWDSEHSKFISVSERREAEGKESLERLYEKLIAQLDEKVKKQLDEFLMVQEEDWVQETDAFYKLGFKTGFHLAVELQEE